MQTLFARLRLRTALVITTAFMISMLAWSCGSHRAPPPSSIRSLDVDAGDRVFRFTSMPRGFDTNSFWIEGPTGIVVIDTQFMPSEAERLLATIRARSEKPIVLAIVLHPNPDKFNGTEVFRRNEIRVITSSQVLAHVPEVDAARRRAFYSRYAPDYPTRAPALDSFGDHDVELNVAGLEGLRLHVLGAGCSAAHVVVEWNGHVFVGDLVANGTHSWLELGLVDEWKMRIDEIEALLPTRIHPGRGASGGVELLRAQRAYLDRVLDIVRGAGPNGQDSLDSSTLEALANRIIAAYPDLSYPVFVRGGIRAVYERVHSVH